MKKIINIVSITLLISIIFSSAVFAGGVKSNNLLGVGSVQEKVKGMNLLLTPDQNMKTFVTKSWDELLKWANNDADVEEYYKEFKNDWMNSEKVLIPKFVGSGKFVGAELRNIFVDSYSSFIHYVFDKPYLHVYFKPAGDEDLYEYLKKNYNIEKYGETIPIVYNGPHIPSDSDYTERVFSKEEIQIGDKKRACVVETTVNGKGDKTFDIYLLENGFEIRVLYFEESGETYDINNLANLSFEFKDEKLFDEKYKENVSQTNKAVPKLRFSKKKVVVKKGKKLDIKLSSVGADVDEYIKRIKFTVNKKKVVKIVKINKKKITIKGMKKGTAIITLKLAGKRSKCKVKVK